MGRLTGKVALITGAGAGIGRAAALLFAAEDARVVVAEFAEESGHATLREIEAAGGTALFVRTDVTDAGSVERAVQAAVTAFGKLDTLYNNVGGTNPKDGSVTEVPIDVFWTSLNRDLFGTFLGCRFAIPEIIKAGGGSIINTASLVGLIGKPRPSQVSYTAAKGAIVSLTRAMAVQYAPQMIRVNAVSPGVTVTERVAKRLEQGAIPKALIDRHLLGLLKPIDIAQAALFLASEESRMITGLILPVDSGATMS